MVRNDFFFTGTHPRTHARTHERCAHISCAKANKKQKQKESRIICGDRLFLLICFVFFFSLRKRLVCVGVHAIETITSIDTLVDRYFYHDVFCILFWNGFERCRFESKKNPINGSTSYIDPLVILIENCNDIQMRPIHPKFRVDSDGFNWLLPEENINWNNWKNSIFLTHEKKMNKQKNNGWWTFL